VRSPVISLTSDDEDEESSTRSPPEVMQLQVNISIRYFYIFSAGFTLRLSMGVVRIIVGTLMTAQLPMQNQGQRSRRSLFDLVEKIYIYIYI